MIYFDLFWGFLRVGLFAFGGAYGAIPLIRDIVLFYGWLDDEALSYMIAVSESTPGPIMVNIATYVGSSQAGIGGAALATLAVILPSFIIILLVMAILKGFIKNRFVQAALGGLKPCIIGIILATGIYLVVHNCFPGKIPTPDVRNIIFTAVLLVVFYGSRVVLQKKMSPILLILISACLGLVAF